MNENNVSNIATNITRRSQVYRKEAMRALVLSTEAMNKYITNNFFLFLLLPIVSTLLCQCPVLNVPENCLISPFENHSQRSKRCTYNLIPLVTISLLSWTCFYRRRLKSWPRRFHVRKGRFLGNEFRYFDSSELFVALS